MLKQVADQIAEPLAQVEKRQKSIPQSWIDAYVTSQEENHAEVRQVTIVLLQVSKLIEALIRDELVLHIKPSCSFSVSMASSLVINVPQI